MTSQTLTKAAAIQVVVDDLQSFADETGNPAIFWHLGRLDVLATYVNAFPLATIGEYLKDANDALAAEKEARGT